MVRATDPNGPATTATTLRILVAVDDSPRAPDVLLAAIEIARSNGAEIRLFQAFAVPPEVPPAAHVVN